MSARGHKFTFLFNQHLSFCTNKTVINSLMQKRQIWLSPSVIGCALFITSQVVWGLYFCALSHKCSLKAQYHFRICLIWKIFMVGISECELRWAYTDVILCLKFRHNCSLVENVLWTSVTYKLSFRYKPTFHITNKSVNPFETKRPIN